MYVAINPVYVVRNKSTGLYYVPGGWTTNAKDANLFPGANTANAALSLLVECCKDELEVVKV